jgi:uncharacterized repeat protein (TIGR01451 family)/LPXTG-motif cell wall-anchored protein
MKKHTLKKQSNVRGSAIVLSLVIGAALLLGSVYSFTKAVDYKLFASLGGSKSQVVPGESLQYEVTLRNDGTQNLTNVRINQNFNSQIVYKNGSTTVEKNGQNIQVDDGWTGAGGANVGALQPGQTVYLKFTGTLSSGATVGSTVQNAVAIRTDQTDWIGQGYTITVVSPDTTTKFTGGDFLKVENNTQQTGWQNSVSVGPSEVVEFLVKITNEGNHDARGVRIKTNLPNVGTAATTQNPSVTISSDNSPSVTDSVTVNGQKPFWFVYRNGHATLFGVTDMYNCPNGCRIPETFHQEPMMIGTVKKGEPATIQITFKADIFTPVSPTPTPTKTPTPTPTKTPTPTPTKTPTPTPTKTPTPTPTKTPTMTPTGTPKTPTPTPTHTATPTGTPTVTPTATPTESARLKICKYNDDNGNGQIDSGEGTMGWNFTYSYQGNDYNVGSRWWDILSRGCRTVDVPVSQWITVTEENRSDWRLTNILSDGNPVGGSSFTYVAYNNTQKDVTFLNDKIDSSPTPTPTPTPTGEPNQCNGTCGSNSNCASGLFCYQGYCRNPACQSESSCGCPGATATPTAPPVLGATAPPILPKTGSNDIQVVAGLLGIMSGGFVLFRKFRLI